MSTTPGPSDDWYVFNLYPPPPVQSLGSVQYLFSDDPVVALQGDAERKRTPRQINAFLAGQTVDDPALGLTRDVAYRSYIVHRLWPESVQPDPAKRVPLGNAPSIAVNASKRQAQLEQVLKRLSDANQQAEQQRLFLFNVIVALEWVPTAEYLERLKWTFRQMSDLLYDITNGAMAFGQVIFADDTWLDSADIQIMASNRLLPRSWVSGLLVDPKHMPIRAGRGIWNKRAQVALNWDEYEAYSALVHEWAHYALNQRDTYLAALSVTQSPPNTNVLVNDPQQDGRSKIVVPQYRAKTDSIMATPNGSSELSPLNLQDIDPQGKYYPGLKIPEPFAGPNRLPLPLPAFGCVGKLAGTLTQLEYRILPPTDCVLKNKSNWVYIIHMDAQEQRVIAQGTFDAMADDPKQGFQLLGAREGDTILVIGEYDNNGMKMPTVWTGTCPASNGKAAVEVAWAAFQPTNLPVITIEPGPVPDPGTMNSRSTLPNATTEPQAQIKIPSVRGGMLSYTLNGTSSTVANQPQVQVFPLGANGALDSQVLSDFVGATSLDGHILIQTNGQPLMINAYSQGGGPASAPNVTTNPITAGSADGEVLLFFDSQDALKDIERQAKDEADEIEKKAEFAKANASVRIVTTTLPSITLNNPPGTALSDSFAIASNNPIPDGLYATLVILMDPSWFSTDQNVFIYRVSDGTQLPTYVPPDSAFAAAPLDQMTAPSLFDSAATQHLECFALYAVPRSQQTTTASGSQTEAATNGLMPKPLSMNGEGTNGFGHVTQDSAAELTKGDSQADQAA